MLTPVPPNGRHPRLMQIAPISTNLILAYIGEHVLGMPRSY
jgi:acyl-CoA dehydrogenase